MSETLKPRCREKPDGTFLSLWEVETLAGDILCGIFSKSTPAVCQTQESAIVEAQRCIDESEQAEWDAFRERQKAQQKSGR